MAPDPGPRPSCPICSKPCRLGRKRPLRWLYTCGDTACVGETRARKTRGNIYGNCGGGPGRTPDAGYSAVHARARRILRGQPCALADDTCRGRMEAALRADIPVALLRYERGQAFYPGLDTETAYRNLCRSHHGREGALRAAASRSPGIAAALAAERLRETCACGGCPLCTMLAWFDDVGATLVAREIEVIHAAAPSTAG